MVQRSVRLRIFLLSGAITRIAFEDSERDRSELLEWHEEEKTKGQENGGAFEDHAKTEGSVIAFVQTGQHIVSRTAFVD